MQHQTNGGTGYLPPRQGTLSGGQVTPRGYQADPIIWWSWRPGIKPRNAVFLGGLITFLALLLGSLGLITLLLGIMDNASAPLQLPGIVSAHTVNNLDGFPRLRIDMSHAHPVGFPAIVSPVVSKLAFHAIHDRDPILLDYSPRLHFLYALQSAGRYYMLPGVSKADNPIGSLALLLLALTLFPYPALLTLWALRDLPSTHGSSNARSMMTARVVAKRAVLPTTTRNNRPGLTPRLSRSWYGIALDPVEQSSVTHCSHPFGFASRAGSERSEPKQCHPERSQASLVRVMTFSITYQTYRSVDEGMLVHIIYSPNLHYVYNLVGARPDVFTGRFFGASPSCP